MDAHGNNKFKETRVFVRRMLAAVDGPDARTVQRRGNARAGRDRLHIGTTNLPIGVLYLYSIETRRGERNDG